MITAAEARAMINSSENRERARECIEGLSSYIEERALMGNRYLLFFIEHLELEDFIVAELKVLGYEVIKEKFWYRGCPAYTIRW